MKFAEGIANRADVEAIEEVPLFARNLPPSTYAMLREGAARAPEKTALRFFLRGSAYEHSQDWTFGELLARITQTANLFHEAGIRKNDVVSYILPNLPETHAVLWGAEATGIANPINPLLDTEGMANLMRAAQTKVLVTLAPFPGTNLWEKVESVLGQVPSLQTVLYVDLTRRLSGLRRLGGQLWSLVAASRPTARPGGPNVEPFHLHLDNQPSDSRLSSRTIQPDDVASLFHTGGTTGRPKLAQRTHRNEVYDAWAAATATGIAEDRTILCGLPLFHAHAAIILGLIPWSRGSTVVLATPKGYRDPDVIPNFWKIVDSYDVNVFSGVPTVFSALLDVPREPGETDPVDFAFCGAAPLPVEVFNRFKDETGIPILEGYGLTEATCVSSVNPRAGKPQPGSVGLRLPYQEMKVASLDADGTYQRDCEPGEVGTILVRGPNVFEGYRDAAQNDGIWIDTGDGGKPWLNTGDLGMQDEDGYFSIEGRRKELIIRGGHNIDPKMIEEPLHEHPAVELAAAVGRPDVHAGELPVAYVQLRSGVTSTEDDLLDHAERRIAEPAAVPKRIHIIDEMPQTAVGKIFKPELERRETTTAYQAAVQDIDGVAQAAVETKRDDTGQCVYIRVDSDPGLDPHTVRMRIDQKLGRFATPYHLTVNA
jgi:fatty-acyl-CoA synthase